MSSWMDFQEVYSSLVHLTRRSEMRRSNKTLLTQISSERKSHITSDPFRRSPLTGECVGLCYKDASRLRRTTTKKAFQEGTTTDKIRTKYLLTIYPSRSIVLVLKKMSISFWKKRHKDSWRQVGNSRQQDESSGHTPWLSTCNRSRWYSFPAIFLMFDPGSTRNNAIHSKCPLISCLPISSRGEYGLRFLDD
jgi:hypothetical protein